MDRIAAEGGFDRVIGTSGTILALGAIAHQMETGDVAPVLHHVTVRADTVHELRERLVAAGLRDRLKMPGIDAQRADILVAGAVILDTILERLGAKSVVLCEWALREGLLLDYIQGHPRTLARAKAYPDVRRRSVVALAERCEYDGAHARHVAKLALSLFDQTAHRHGLGASARALLEHAALLHDIGHHISYPGHHKHTYYLIKNGDLRGFHPEEIELLANVARYHRRAHPRRTRLVCLPAPRLTPVGAGAGRLPAGGRRPRPLAPAGGAGPGGERELGPAPHPCGGGGRPRARLWGAPRRTQLLEEALGLAVRVEAVAAEPGARPAPRRESIVRTSERLRLARLAGWAARAPRRPRPGRAPNAPS